MFKRNRFFLMLLLIPLLLEQPVGAEQKTRTMEINLQAVHQNTPYFKRSDERKPGNSYLIKMIKIQGNDLFKSLPETEANVLYYGEVKLGSPARTHGVLVDLEGKNKLLWVDSDADKNYAEETCYQIFKSDRVPGVNFYFSPAPINFLVRFVFEGRQFESLIQFDLPFLAVARTGYQDLFFLSTRSWFTGVIHTEEAEIRVAIVDTNDNGIYRDSDDLIIIDRNYDLNFTPQESSFLAKTKTVKLESKRWNVLPEFLPEKLILTER